ncbi:MAG: TRAM domain-containing protein [Mycobacteriales bacterium]|nr:TRAM domain-containing protein [Mycobacteriales bacterium]
MIVEVGAPAAGGSFVARADDGRVVFVRHALPGERVRVEITGEAKAFLRADAVEVLEPSPDRVEAPCPFAGPGRCGGCDYQHVTLAAQRRIKALLVEEQLRRLAGVERTVVVEGLSDDALGWRSRVSFAADGDGRLGLHRHRSDELVLVDRCLIADPAVSEAVTATWPGAASVEVAVEGSQRVATVQARGRTGVTVPDLDTGVVLNGRPVAVPHGLRHEVLGRSFEVSAGGFWQVHPLAATALAQAVLDGLDPQPGESVADLYAGAGLFAALLGERVGPTGSVTAVEGDPRACADASRNTADQPWVRIRTTPVTAALVTGLRADLVVLDPPRAGAGLDVTRALAASPARALVYVACDPASFARDLAVLREAGWELADLRALDLFPMTEHVELVAVLRR